MTLRANGFDLVCNKCTRVEAVPALTESYARVLEGKLGWRRDDDTDYCPECERQLEAAGQLPARGG